MISAFFITEYPNQRAKMSAEFIQQALHQTVPLTASQTKTVSTSLLDMQGSLLSSSNTTEAKEQHPSSFDASSR